MLFTPIKPMLLHMGNNNEIDDDPSWIYDIKWDGWRILLHKQGERIEAFTRHGNNVTAKFPELQEVALLLRNTQQSLIAKVLCLEMAFQYLMTLPIVEG
ncbi:hypothetical protein ABC382_08750 [Lysinibacillus sp. 1P01SD]|uniref:ATP-dependent DNA ligase n=1 Tax=Lysinibacillus TaxID=400634 RepID=UPI003889BB90